MNIAIGLFVASLMALATLSGCDRRTDRYTVIKRTNIEGDFVPEIPVVLEHNGYRYYARCNNIKAVADSKENKHCELHVGMTVSCQLFKSRDVSGYDLICGSRRNEKGDLDTYGENELLFIEKEEN